MKRTLVFLLAAFAAFFSSADVLQATDGVNKVVVDTEKECDKELADKIPEEYRSLFKHAEVLFQGKTPKACWAFEPNTGEIYVQLEDGRAIRVNPLAFKPFADV